MMYFGFFYMLVVLMLCPDVYCGNCVDCNHVVLANTYATTIMPSWFANCMGGKYLVLSYNKINRIEKTIVRNIEVRDISFCAVIVRNIEVRDISFCAVSSTYPGAFVGMRNIYNSLPEDFIYNKNPQTVADLLTHFPLSVYNSSMGEVREVILHDNLITAFKHWANFRQGGQYYDLRWNNFSTLTNDYSWTFYRSMHDEVMTDLRYNNIREWHDCCGQQNNDPNEKRIGLETVIMDFRENPLVCGCNTHNFLTKTTQSFFQSSNSYCQKIMCYDLPELRGKLALYEAQNNAALVSNICQYCPSQCLYKNRPGTRVWNTDFRYPPTVPELPYSNISSQSDNNIISMFDNITFFSKITYKFISLIPTAVNLSVYESFNETHFVDLLYVISIMVNYTIVDVRKNSLTSNMSSLKKTKFQCAYFQGNLSECSCGQPRIVNLINIARVCANETKHECENYTIIELETKLKCHRVESVVLNTVLFVVLVIVIVLLVTAIKWPYETKVLLFKIFPIHSSNRYQVDKTMGKTYDMYVSFDDDDPYVRQWVMKVLFKQLESKKPFYRLCVAARDASAGPEADGRLQLIENSRRLLIILSENYERHKWCEYEICLSETLEHNHGRILYLLYDKTSEENAKQEPCFWKMKDRMVFRLEERLLWSKLRYEMPRKPLPEKQLIKEGIYTQI